MTRRTNPSTNAAVGLVFLALVGLALGGVVWFVSSLGSSSSPGAAFDAASDAAASSYSAAADSGLSSDASSASLAPVDNAPQYQPSQTTYCTNGTYTNSADNTVCRPETSSTVPAGATAQCADGTYSFSQSARGTCSHHGGVAQWLN